MRLSCYSLNLKPFRKARIQATGEFISIPFDVPFNVTKCYVAQIVGLISNRCFELFLRNERTKKEHRERWRADRRRNAYEDLQNPLTVELSHYRVQSLTLVHICNFSTRSTLVAPLRGYNCAICIGHARGVVNSTLALAVNAAASVPRCGY